MSKIEIIDTPEVKTFWQHLTDLSFTALMWATWLYLFLPVINMLMWLLGFSYFYTELIENAGYRQMLNLFETTGWAIVLAFLLLRLWGLWNYMHYGRPSRDRRHHAVQSTTIDRMAEHYALSPKEIVALQRMKEVVWPMQKDMEPDKDVAKWVAMPKGVEAEGTEQAQGSPQPA